MDMTPTKEYLDDLQKRFKQIVDGEYEPMGPADLFVILKALNESIARWRPVAGLTLSELTDAAKQGADAWAPILASCKMMPLDFAKAVRAVSHQIEERHERFEEILTALIAAFGLDAFDVFDTKALPEDE